MKQLTRLITVSLLVAGLIHCKKDDDNKDQQTALLLAMASNAGSSAGTLTAAQETQKNTVAATSTSVASSVSTSVSTSISTSISSSATSAGSFSAQLDNLKNQGKFYNLVADIMKNGRDPYYSREAVRKFFTNKLLEKMAAKAQTPKKTSNTHLSALSGSYSDGSVTIDPTKGTTTKFTATFSGTQDGVSYTQTEAAGDYMKKAVYSAFATNPNYSGCTFDPVKVYTQTGKQGTIDITDGKLTLSQTMLNKSTQNTSGGYDSQFSLGVSSDFSATLKFSNYGMLVQDPSVMVKFYKILKTLYSKSMAEYSCDEIKQYAGFLNMLYTPSLGTTMNSGTLTATSNSTGSMSSTTTYTSTQSGTTYTSKTTNVGKSSGTTTASSKSTDLKIENVDSPMDVTYKQTYSFDYDYGTSYEGGKYTYTASKVTGTSTLSISGTFAGSPLNLTETINF